MTSLTDQIGRVLAGRYRLVAPVGTGASAHVYAADDVVLSRRVAVKVLHPALVGDQAFLRRFRAEARAAAALNHPHVMRVFDWGEDADGPFLVLEHLGGGSLRDLLDAGHLLSLSQAALVGAQAAHGLAYAHRRGIVHRDVKPANLLFDDEGSLRVADFGLARALAEAAWTEPTGAMLGTARYASPEQAEGRVVDDRADVYSLALALFEAITGWVPFSADTTVATLMARLGAHLPMLSELGPLGPILAQAAIPEPLARLDAAGLAVDLEILARDFDPPVPLPLAGPAHRWTAPERDPTMVGEPIYSDRRRSVEGGLTNPPIPAVEAAGSGFAGAAPAPPAGAPVATGPAPAAVPAADLAAPAIGRSTARAAPASPAGAPTATAPPARRPPQRLPPAPRRRRQPRPKDAVQASAGAPPATASPALPPPRSKPARPAPEPRGGQAPARPPRPNKASRAPRRPERGTVLGLVIAAVVVVLLLVAAGTGLMGYRQWVTSRQTAPSVVGKDLVAARSAAAAADLRISVTGQRYDATVAAGDVISQSIAPGTHLSGGKVIDVTLSLGAAPVPVPSLTGDDGQQAAQALTSAGLVASQSPSQYSETVPQNDVISWAPDSGLVRPGTTVTYSLSLGPKPRSVPDLTGWNWAGAQADLEGLRLVPIEEPENSNTVQAGLVISTSPEAHAIVPRGSPVDVVVSLGPKYVTIPPDLYSMTPGQAESALAEIGLPLGGTYGFGSLIIASEPTAGSRVKVGTPVFLYLF